MYSQGIYIQKIYKEKICVKFGKSTKKKKKDE